jgi:cold shock CspA family protein/ribosome-associated translation inhibitor RaiA
MPVPVQVTFRHMEPAPAAEEQIRSRAAELEEFYPRIIACHVVLEADHRHHRQGNLFRVRIEITVPGRVLSVGRDPAAHHAHEDAHVAIRDAFDAVRRQLEDHIRRARGDEKTHAVPQIGRIKQIFPDRGYAFLVTETGEEVYVHRNSVVNDGFAKLRVGDQVRYELSPDGGEKGPQASTVVPQHL